MWQVTSSFGEVSFNHPEDALDLFFSAFGDGVTLSVGKEKNVQKELDNEE